MHAYRHGNFGMRLDQFAHARIFLKVYRDAQQVTDAEVDGLADAAREIMPIRGEVQTIEMAMGINQHGNGQYGDGVDASSGDASGPASHPTWEG
jgi:hypothetical protein